MIGLIVFCDHTGILTCFLQCCELFAAHLQKLVEVLLGLLIFRLILILFGHYVFSLKKLLRPRFRRGGCIIPITVILLRRSFDSEDLIAAYTCRCLNVNGITDLVADECAAHRALVGDLSLKAVCLGGTYDLVFYFF